ncbi:hypothetical protein K438DRAFT_1747738 [Mycena galopus ATCC 62051]|nr:hypothetical protein K438DRAFT_1747738 [Mycena galopus ATCC 62051]
MRESCAQIEGVRVNFASQGQTSVARKSRSHVGWRNGLKDKTHVIFCSARDTLSLRDVAENRTGPKHIVLEMKMMLIDRGKGPLSEPTPIITGDRADGKETKVVIWSRYLAHQEAECQGVTSGIRIPPRLEAANFISQRENVADSSAHGPKAVLVTLELEGTGHWRSPLLGDSENIRLTCKRKLR